MYALNRMNVVHHKINLNLICKSKSFERLDCHESFNQDLESLKKFETFILYYLIR